MKAIFLRLFMAVSLLLAATNSFAWFFDNDDWECFGPFGKIPGCNPYDEWDPRYWMEEMEQEFDDDDDYYYGPYGGYGPYGPGYGYGGYGPGYGYGGYGPGYGYGGYGPGYGYGGYGPGYGYGGYGPGYGYVPYGYAPAPATTTQ